MSVSKEAKKELAIIPEYDCCKAALISAVIHTAGLVSFIKGGMRVIIETENPDLSRLVGGIVSDMFKHVAVMTEKSSIVLSGEGILDMLIATRILKIRSGITVVAGIDPYLIGSECCKISYIKGAFLGCGAISTSKGYHMEFSFSSKRLQEDIIKLLFDFEIKAGAGRRGEKYTVYLKDKDLISDMFALIGATKTVLNLNSLIADRSMIRDVSRAANCDIANVNRLVAASLVQQEAIRKLKNIDSKKLRDTAEARLKYPDLSYDELSKILGISKGALKYRLNRLVKISEEHNNE